MTNFAKLREAFDVNWTSVFVGWRGLGPLSPWPNRWTEFPTLISPEEILAFAEERLTSASDPEQTLLTELLTLDVHNEPREVIDSLLKKLSNLDGGDEKTELRKWRVTLLEQLLETIPQDPIYGLLALTEFWQDFGCPPDSPHRVQGNDGSTPREYYTEQNFRKLLNNHHEWIESEKKQLKPV